MIRSSQRRISAPRLFLLLVLAFYLIIGVTFTVVFPLGEAPDEPAHFTYIRYLATEKKLPVLKPRYEENETLAAHHPPAYYALVAAIVSPFVDGKLSLYRNPLFDWSWKTTHFLHGSAHSFPWRGDHLAWHIARFVSLLLGLATLVIIYVTSYRIFGSEVAAAACVAYVALNPQFIYMNSYLTNDVLATLAGVLLIFAALVFYYNPTLTTVLFSAFAISLAVLAKPNALMMLPGFIFAFILRWRSLSMGLRLRALVILALVPSLLSGWWFLRNVRLYGDPLALSMLKVVFAPNHYDAPLSIPELISLLRPMFTQTFKSSWGYFGWLTLPLPDQLFLAIFALHLFAALGLLAKLRSLLKNPITWILGLSALGLLVSFVSYNRVTNSSGWQGRYFSPSVSVMAIAFVAGWRYWFRKRDWALAVALSCAGLSLSLYALVSTILPTYLPPKFLSTNVGIPNRMDIAFEGGLHLVGYDLSAKKVKPGDSIKVTIYWKIDDTPVLAHQAQVAAYTFTGKCVSPTVKSYLFKRYPTTMWKRGMIVKDEYYLRIEKDVEQVTAPITVFVSQGLDSQPALRFDKPENKVEIAWIAVGARGQPRARPQKQLDTTFGDGLIKLIGYTIEGEPIKAGSTITVTLFWKSEKLTESNYQVFVHLLNERGELIAQHDSPPRLGLYPTSVWSLGEVVIDEHPLTIPQDYAGKGRILVGLYSLETLERLVVRNEEGVEIPARAVFLGELN